MAEKHNYGVPKKIRPYLVDSDIFRFHKIFLASGHTSYTQTMTLLLDVFEEIGTDNKNAELLAVAKLIEIFKGELKKTSPALYTTFNNMIMEDGRN